MSRWFRFYNGVVSDPKAQMLAPDLFKHWVNVLCIASQHDGELPALGVTAFMLGRIAEPKTAELLAKLHAAGLLDKTEKSFKPHNWDSRQYKHDSNDPTNAERQKRYRNRKRNASNGESNGSDDVTAKRPEYTDGTDIDVADDARERSPLVTREAQALADELLLIAGHNLEFVPPGWCGAAMRVQAWLSNGWVPEIIKIAVRGAVARKRGSPANSVQFFENAIAEEVARQAAPLPVVAIREAEKLTVTHGKSKNGIIEAADDLCRKIASFDGPASDDLGVRDRAGPAPLRLLSDR